MLSTLKTSIWRYCDLSWSSLAKIKSWFRPDTVRDGFKLQSVADNLSLRIVQVDNSVGQTVSFNLIEPCFLVNHIVNPQATPTETQFAGDWADAALARMAQREGVTHFLIVVPSNFPSHPDEQWIRIIPRNVPQIAAMQS